MPVRKKHHKDKKKTKSIVAPSDMETSKNTTEMRPLATLSYIAGMSNNSSINNNSIIQIDLDPHSKVNMIDVTIISRYFGSTGEIFHVKKNKYAVWYKDSKGQIDTIDPIDYCNNNEKIIKNILHKVEKNKLILHCEPYDGLDKKKIDWSFTHNFLE